MMVQGECKKDLFGNFISSAKLVFYRMVKNLLLMMQVGSSCIFSQCDPFKYRLYATCVLKILVTLINLKNTFIHKAIPAVTYIIFGQATQIPRSDLPQHAKAAPMDCTPLIITNHPTLELLRKAIKQLQHTSKVLAD